MQHLEAATARLEGADVEVAATDSRLRDKAERLRAKLQQEVQAARKQVLGGWRAGLCEDCPGCRKLALPPGLDGAQMARSSCKASVVLGWEAQHRFGARVTD